MLRPGGSPTPASLLFRRRFRVRAGKVKRCFGRRDSSIIEWYHTVEQARSVRRGIQDILHRPAILS